jgi:hypothetical protein
MIALFVASLLCTGFRSGNNMKQKSSLTKFSGSKSGINKNLEPNSETVTDKDGCYAAYEALVVDLEPTKRQELGILSEKTALQVFTETCPATAAKTGCVELVTLLEDEDNNPVSATDKATFKTVCKVEKPKDTDTDTGGNNDNDIFSFKLDNLLLLISTILLNFYFMI